MIDSKKWIEICSEGLTIHEVNAIIRIEQNFIDDEKKSSLTVKCKDFKTLYQQTNSIFPWKGYAGFRLADRKNAYEFDLLIFTHCSILVIELKDWHGKISNTNGRWCLNNRDMGKSPVTVTRNKAYLIMDKLQEINKKYSNIYVNYLVVMTGKATFTELPEAERNYVMQLENFLKLKDEEEFRKKFGHKDKTSFIDPADLAKEFFQEKTIPPKPYRKSGYIAEEDALFVHPNHLYKEYLAHSEEIKTDLALLRRWDFNRINDNSAKTPDGRYRIVKHEYDVLEYIKIANEDLFNSCLSHKLPPIKEDITAQYTDIFSYLPSNRSFNIFIEQNANKLNKEERLQIVYLLLKKLSNLHKIEIAHRDINYHSIWITDAKKITFSNFISAYYPKKGTIGNIRDILSVSGIKDLAFEYFPITKPTSYVQDIRSATVLAWHIINAKSISPNNIKIFAEEIKTNNDWYADIFREALSEHPFTDGKAFFDAFDKKIPKQKYDFTFDESKLDYYKHPYHHNLKYPLDTDKDYLVDASDKEVYLSNGKVVKAWLNIQYQNNNAAAQIVWKFLERISFLKNLAPDYLPTIHEFGIAAKTCSLFIVSDYIKGYTWEELQQENLELNHKYEIIYKLIQAIEHLHGLNIYHGDLHPKNIKISVDSNSNAKLYLLDLVDYTPNGKSNLNYYYSPPTAEEASERERDNFAVMRMACELLNIKWGEDSVQFSEITTVIKLECSDRETGFISLERFKKALQPKKNIEFIDIEGKNQNNHTFQIFPEENELFVSFNKYKNDIKNKIYIEFFGIGGSFKTVFNLATNNFDYAFQPKEKQELTPKIKKDSNLSIPFGLNILGDESYELENLSKILLNWPAFTQVLSTFEQTQINLKQPNLTTSLTSDSLNPTEAIEELSVNPTLNADTRQQLSTRNLWTAIINKETDSLPYVIAVMGVKNNQANNKTSPKIEVDHNNKQWLLFYETGRNEQVLDHFRKDDRIKVIVKDSKNREFSIGLLNLQFSTSNYLCFDEEPKNTHILKNNPILYLQNNQTAASLRRRKKAVERILDGESVINQLPEYFEANCTIPSTSYNIKIGEEEFRLYERDNGHGGIIRLNNAQRDAFTKLLQNGPLSLLQGPPGTGKTEFIAAFVHFLFTQQSVQKILLVSQSHEAVNTAAERIRKHCQRLEKNISIVRFSNRESAVSAELQDVFSQNLVISKREILQASQIKRICEIGQALGIPEDYLKLRAELQLDIGGQIERLNRLEKYSSRQNDDIAEYKRLGKKITQHIHCAIENFTDNNKNIYTDKIIVDKTIVDKILPTLINKLDEHFCIQPKSSTQAENLINLTWSMQQALSNEKVNYDEFLARSRQLVVGTCVGIGQGNIEIDKNIYDWVIIDEAARSISSELAIAMQSAKRILLVGDHKQLPPLYSEEHKRALARHLGISDCEEEFERILGSDFERVFESPYGQHTCATLKTQYRMAPAIGNLISECFYEGKLENGRSAKEIPDVYTSVHQHFSSCVTWLDTSNLPNSYHQEKDEHGSLINETEADLIIQHLQYLAKNDDFIQSNIIQDCLEKQEAVIGIICMYGEQKNLIRKKFNEKKWSDQFRQLVKIDTVDSYQGKENRIIMLSITRHDKTHSTGFLKLPNRINVALSRAMDRLIIVGATAMWRKKNTHLPLGKVLAMMESSENKLAYSIIQAKPNNY
ncbi:AAA domain-containing protein [Snodgrassella alvi]|uniref:AAA domain-containing protein n=1 Tax=Snodgrassella alvi TaxID=1196083 RepID=UPI000C1EC3FF|nr:AAA domain-containing protein [Snodgrassella alvi]PIT47024.1 hypothetical protein BHC51_06895 [Snodgrassella alvi]